MVSKKKYLGALFTGLLVFQCVYSAAPAEAAYAVEDSVVRQNTKQILDELNARQGKSKNAGIHGDTSSIDVTTKAILQTLGNVWRQTEQQTRKLDDVYDGKELKRSLQAEKLASFLGGSCLNFADVLNPLEVRDDAIKKALNSSIAEKWKGLSLFNGTGWEGLKGTINAQLTDEMNKLLKQSMNKTVFPELSTKEILDIASKGTGTTNDVVKKFFDNNFPKIEITDINNKNPYEIRENQQEKTDTIRASVSQARQSVSQSLMVNNAKMQENLVRIQKINEAISKAESELQVAQLKTEIDILTHMNQALAALNDSTVAQQKIMEAEAADKARQNEEVSSEAVMNAAGNYESSYADKLNNSEIFKKMKPY